MLKRPVKLKLILVVAALLAVTAVAVVFFQFRLMRRDLPSPLSDVAGKAVMALVKVHQTATKNGQVQWELTAETAQLQAETGQMVLQSPQVDFFLEDGSRVHLTAAEGILNTHNNDIEVRGNVQVRDDRYTLMTEVLAYEHDRRRLFTKAPVQIVGATVNLRADTMIYDLTVNRGEFSGQVKGSLHENLAM